MPANITRKPYIGRSAADHGIDLSAAEQLLKLPIPIPVHPMEWIDSTGLTMGMFNSDRESFGIEYSAHLVEEVEDGQVDPNDLNEILLHELVHARQWFDDPLGSDSRIDRELDEFGYEDSPHEVDARTFAREMQEAGVQVYFPERANTLGATSQSGDGTADDQLRRAKADLEQSIAEIDQRIADLLARG